MVVVLVLGLAYLVVYYLTNSGTAERPGDAGPRRLELRRRVRCDDARPDHGGPLAVTPLAVHSVFHACDYTAVVRPQVGTTLWTT